MMTKTQTVVLILTALVLIVCLPLGHYLPEYSVERIVAGIVATLCVGVLIGFWIFGEKE